MIRIPPEMHNAGHVPSAAWEFTSHCQWKIPKMCMMLHVLIHYFSHPVSSKSCISIAFLMFSRATNHALAFICTHLSFSAFLQEAAPSQHRKKNHVASPGNVEPCRVVSCTDRFAKMMGSADCYDFWVHWCSIFRSSHVLFVINMCVHVYKWFIEEYKTRFLDVRVLPSSHCWRLHMWKYTGS